MSSIGVLLVGNVFADELLKALRSELFVIFVVLALGYLLGRITIKGVSFGSSGVFIVALIVGVLLSKFGSKMGFAWIANSKGELTGGSIAAIVKNIGLALFVTGVGFIAGPTFIRNFKKKAFSYITIGATVVVIGTAICILIIALDPNIDGPIGSGLLMGALTSTPGQASAQGVFGDAFKSTIAAAVGVTYPFGVLGVVLFVQLMPKILRKDMAAEVAKLKATAEKNVKIVDEAVVVQNEMIKPGRKLFVLDSLGLCPFAFAVVLGILLGSLTIPLGSSAKFALGTTGGAIIVGLLFGHFGHVGPVSLQVPKTTLNPLREVGLVLFLTGSGIEGGLKFLDMFRWSMLLYGALMTLVPMIAVFLIARYAFKLELLNNLGSITGGMTSTPALGALIHVSKTDDVAQSYAATYPIALFLLVLAPMVISWIFPV